LLKNNSSDLETEFKIPDVNYDDKIYSLTGKLKRVELGDYLHILVEDNKGGKNSYWIHPSLGENKVEKLYNFIDKELDINIKFKYCNTINYLKEFSKPRIINTCIDIEFLN